MCCVSAIKHLFRLIFHADQENSGCCWLPNLLSFFLAVEVLLTTEFVVVFVAVGVLLAAEFVVVGEQF